MGSFSAKTRGNAWAVSRPKHGAMRGQCATHTPVLPFHLRAVRLELALASTASTGATPSLDCGAIAAEAHAVSTVLSALICLSSDYYIHTPVARSGLRLTLRL